MDELIGLIRNAQRISLISHIHPDGDAVGSLLGMTLGLQQLGKQVTAVLTDGVPRIFHFLPGWQQVVTELPPTKQADLCICLDLPDAHRTGQYEAVCEYAVRKKLAVIDHHPRGDLQKLSQAVYHDQTASSCAELCYKLLQDCGVRFTADIATPLLTGMYTDTGAFQYENTTNQTLELAAELMRRGGRLQKIAANISHHKSVAALKLLGIALERIQITCGGRCAVSVITQADMQECQAKDEDVSGIIGAINVLPEVEFSLLLTETASGKVRGSLRTTDGKSLDVSRIARVLGGAGHPRASGFMLPGVLRGNPQEGWRVESLLLE